MGSKLLDQDIVEVCRQKGLGRPENIQALRRKIIQRLTILARSGKPSFDRESIAEALRNIATAAAVDESLEDGPPKK